ncbi:MAG TPA: transmembrane 220 family protein [Catalimonadaceae bacterium]|nr:transmembrane 220 family protein [Catalimonadaceae bacterium]
MKVFSGFFFLVFLAFALLQLNDNSPLIWLSVYGFSAYTCGSAFRNYYNPMLLSLMCLGYFLGAIFLFPTNFSEWIQAEEQARSLDMKLPFIEEARESMGLTIAFLVNTIFLIKGYKGAKAIIPNYDKATEKPFE